MTKTNGSKSRGELCDRIDAVIGDRIRKLRMARELSQEKLGDMLGVTFQQIQKYEKGTNSVASSRMPTLCNALRCTPNDLIPYDVSLDRVEVPRLSMIGITIAKACDELPVRIRNSVSHLVETLGEVK